MSRISCLGLSNGADRSRFPCPDQGEGRHVPNVGLGTTADSAGRDVAGKAVFIYSILTPGGRNHTASDGAIQRTNAAWAAMVFVVMGMPGNALFQPVGGGGTVVPTFTISPPRAAPSAPSSVRVSRSGSG